MFILLGEPMMEDKKKRLTLDDVRVMDYQTLLDTIQYEMEEAGKIDGQLNNAKAQVQASGNYSDPVWFQKAKSALKIKRRLIMAMQERVKSMKKERSSIESKFMRIAKTVLAEETYQLILDSAEHMND
jgi:hypothetical protein